MRALRALWRLVFGSHCARHDRHFRSDFCPFCVRAMTVRFETHDVVLR